MRERPKRVLLFRSGRHLTTALDAIERALPGAEVTVVATPPAEAAVEQAGIPETRRIIYDRTPFFNPLAFLTSSCYWRALAARPDHVAVLWNSPSGEGQSNVDHTAMLVAPGGFVAITPNGSLVLRHWLPLFLSEARRGMLSVFVGGAIGIVLYLPARAIQFSRQRQTAVNRLKDAA